MQLHSVKTKKQHSRNLFSRGKVKETKQIAERVQGYDQGLVNALEGAAPGVQVERRSTAGTGSGIVKVKAMSLGIHVEYTSGTNKIGI